jgi:hypothetical protein
MPATTAPTVTLCVRSLVSRTGCQERVLKQLQRLSDAGTLESVSVRVWGTEVGFSTTAVETVEGESILDTVGEFRAWADHNGVSLEPFYEDRTRVSGLTGEERATLRLPVLALAEYDDGDLVSVTPHERECGVRTVEDRIAMLGQTTSDTTGVSVPTSTGAGPR